MNRKIEKRKNPITLVGSFSAFFLTAALAILVVLCILAGSKAYYSIRTQAEENTGVRTGIMYITGKLRTADADCRIEVTEQDGSSVLHLISDYDDEPYETCIFCREGSLREVFALYPADLDEIEGDSVCTAQNLRIWQDEMWHIELTNADGVLICQQLSIPEGVRN